MWKALVFTVTWACLDPTPAPLRVALVSRPSFSNLPHFRYGSVQFRYSSGTVLVRFRYSSGTVPYGSGTVPVRFGTVPVQFLYSSGTVHIHLSGLQPGVAGRSCRAARKSRGDLGLLQPLSAQAVVHLIETSSAPRLDSFAGQLWFPLRVLCTQ